MLYLVTGPPASGKSTWVREHAKHGDITIDYDAIANVLTPPGGDPHDPPQHIKAVTKAARQAAIDTALTMSREHDVYVIHSMPSPTLVAHYRAHGARVITIDPGRAVVLAHGARPNGHGGWGRRPNSGTTSTPPANNPRRPANMSRW